MVGRDNEIGSHLLFRRVRRAFALVFLCCEVVAAVAVGPVETMPCCRRSGHDDLLRRESCISILRSSLPESEPRVSCAKIHLFDVGRHGLHEAIGVRFSLVVVLRRSWSRRIMEE
jgi:hypothetical protein